MAREGGGAPSLVRLDQDPAAQRWAGVFKPGDVAARVGHVGEE